MRLAEEDERQKSLLMAQEEAERLRLKRLQE